MAPMKTKSRLHNQRGSLLIVAMIFSAIIAICLTSYIHMIRTSMIVSQRSFFANNCMNVTETGLEQAIDAINNNSWPTSTWTISGANATATFTGFNFGQGATGQVQVYVQNYLTTTPFLVAKGTVTVPNSDKIIKMVEVTGVVNRSLFGKGMVGKQGVTFSGGNASVDAWNSNPTNAAAGTYVPVAYSAATAVAQGSVAAVGVTADVSASNSSISGTASVGGAVTDVIIGPNGYVGPSLTPSPGVIDPNSVAGNFTANLPNATAPTPTTINSPGAISGNTTLPAGGDNINVSDNTYYYSVPSVTEQNKTLTIAAGKKVVLIITAAAGSQALKLGGGSGAISISAGGNLAVYTAGNIDCSGQGIANANGGTPTSMQIYGTATATGQSVNIVGNGGVSAVVYAPNADVSIKGNGDVFGAVVGNTVTMTGGGAFHYDLSLANMNGNPLFQPSKWVELTSAADRATYATQLP
jgi:hypothetical protein